MSKIKYQTLVSKVKKSDSNVQNQNLNTRVKNKK